MTSREQMLEKIKSALYYAALPGDDAEIPTLAADLLDELESTSAQAPGVEVARMRDHYVAALEIGQLELFDRPTSRYPDLPKARKP